MISGNPTKIDRTKMNGEYWKVLKVEFLVVDMNPAKMNVCVPAKKEPFPIGSMARLYIYLQIYHKNQPFM